MQALSKLMALSAAVALFAPGMSQADQWYTGASPYGVGTSSFQQCGPNGCSTSICGPNGCSVQGCGPNGCGPNGCEISTSPYGTAPYYQPNQYPNSLNNSWTRSQPYGSSRDFDFNRRDRFQGDFTAYRTRGPAVGQGSIPYTMRGIAELPEWEQRLALEQRVCPLTGELLGSRGKPVRTMLNGQSVFVCCQDCVNSQYRGGNNSWLIGNSTSPYIYPANNRLGTGRLY